jgi:hypothetical protein
LIELNDKETLPESSDPFIHLAVTTLVNSFE